jgi:hypothetical protein
VAKESSSKHCWQPNSSLAYNTWPKALAIQLRDRRTSPECIGLEFQQVFIRSRSSIGCIVPIVGKSLQFEVRAMPPRRARVVAAAAKHAVEEDEGLAARSAADGGADRGSKRRRTDDDTEDEVEQDEEMKSHDEEGYGWARTFWIFWARHFHPTWISEMHCFGDCVLHL